MFKTLVPFLCATLSPLSVRAFLDGSTHGLCSIVPDSGTGFLPPLYFPLCAHHATLHPKRDVREVSCSRRWTSGGFSFLLCLFLNSRSARKKGCLDGVLTRVCGMVFRRSGPTHRKRCSQLASPTNHPGPQGRYFQLVNRENRVLRINSGRAIRGGRSVCGTCAL